MRSANEEEKKAFADALKRGSVPAIGDILDLLENKKPKIYIVYCTYGDIESSYSKATSAWTDKKDADEEVNKLTEAMKEATRIEEKWHQFCSDCPVFNYNLSRNNMIRLAKERCSEFMEADELSSKDEVYCENERFYCYDPHEWHSYGIWEIELN
jgi:hypothetical protein